jgi:DNA recombination protein RmuC
VRVFDDANRLGKPDDTSLSTPGMATNDVLLSAATLVVAFGVLLLVWGLRSELRARNGDEVDVDTDQLSAAIGQTWRDLDFDRAVTEVESHAREIRELHGDIESMLRSPQERGEFGEQQLDVILSDHLPPEMYGVRKQVVGGKTPDAHIESASGVICIDSKFPLDNYERAIQADGEERERHQRQFRQDVESQLSKIASDYVQPAEGTTDFAFAFIPSESVYYHLVTEEYDLLREYTKAGVQVVSPLTFGHKLELIKADVQARKLSEQAEDIQKRLERLGARFDDVEDEWSTLHRHVKNAEQKAEDVNREYGRLRDEFDRIDRPTLED